MNTILILFIFVIILVAVCFILKKNIKLFSIPINLKKYLVMTYLIVLLVCTIAVYFISHNTLLKYRDPNLSTTNMPNLDDFQQLASQNQLNTSKSFVKKTNWNFNYNEKMLKIKTNSNNFMLVGEIKNVDDGKIEVTNYVTNSYLNGVIITNKLRGPSVNLYDNELEILDSDDSDNQIKIAQFSLDFSTQQFVKKIADSKNLSFTSFFGMKIIYIKIPKSLEIQNPSSVGIQMIN